MIRKYWKIQSDVTKWLKENAYSFEDMVNIVGCGNKTMNRYERAGIVKATTSGANSNSRYFSQEELNKAQFVYDMYKASRTPVPVSAAIYDYLKAKRTKIDLKDILDRIEDYKLGYQES